MKRQLTIVMFFLTNIRALLRDSIICILHNDSNTSNLVGFKMNHHPFLMWKLLIWNILFSCHIRLWQRFSNLSFPKSIIYVSFLLHGILGIYFFFLGLSWKSIWRPLWNFTKFSPKRGSRNYKENYANITFFFNNLFWTEQET